MKERAEQPGLGVSAPQLCLDFVNTEGRVRNSPPDRLDTLELFLEWAAAHQLADRGALETLWPSGGDATADTERFLVRARQLREALYRIFAALHRGESPAEDDLETVNRELAEALPRLRLSWGDDGARWELSRPHERLEELLWLIAGSAADLLRCDLLDRVKECDGTTCSWLFIDESRNRSRRWCDMADCGNRAKARRYYHRHSPPKNRGQ